jgi:hypothetical protein
MKNDKINHPFRVPEDFFDDFGTVVREKMALEEDMADRKPLILSILKYVAFLVFVLIVGYQGAHFFGQKEEKQGDEDLYTVDNVFSQVSDDDITNYLIENVNQDDFN